MQVTLKENDLVYTPYGYGVLVSLGRKKQIDLLEEPPAKPADNGASEKDKQAPERNGDAPKILDREEAARPPLDDASINIVTVNLRWGGIVYLDDRLLKRKIRVNVKSFFGERTKFALTADITTTIAQLKAMIIEAAGENSKNICNLRLLYPMGYINELSVGTNTLENYRIPDNGNLILLVQTIFSLDPTIRGEGIKLSNNNLTANKNGGDVDFQTVLGSIPMNSGRYYWEIKIDKFVDEEDLFIGVARKEVDLNMRPLDTKLYWGYMPLCARKFGPDGELVEYGFSCKAGDILGVLLEFKQGVGTLSFYKNGAKCGTAYTCLLYTSPSPRDS
eukprot:TRINITY_DN9234_c0_g1_i1.p1 TRINITY_DN9234_c0_g1~~TRINITY_DN9234_c0_g1_i1.p1  ORF type:complete len:333 (+),score=89.79 TRINITY_DN9234_c0_g1_i1:26-1024(+)